MLKTFLKRVARRSHWQSFQLLFMSTWSSGMYKWFQPCFKISQDWSACHFLLTILTISCRKEMRIKQIISFFNQSVDLSLALHLHVALLGLEALPGVWPLLHPRWGGIGGEYPPYPGDPRQCFVKLAGTHWYSWVRRVALWTEKSLAQKFNQHNDPIQPPTKSCAKHDPDHNARVILLQASSL